jgi:HEAT repeat protein
MKPFGATLRNKFFLVAIIILGSAGCHRHEAAKPLISRLTDVSPSWVRTSALNEMDKLTIDEKKALILPLSLRLEDHDPYVRQNAAYTLAHLSPLTQDAIPALQKASADNDQNVRRFALVALARMGQNVDTTVAMLLKEMQNPPDQTRLAAITGIALLGEPAKAAAPVLAQDLQDKNPYICEFSVQALIMMGPGAAAAQPQLIQGLHSPNRNMRYLCSVALRRIGSPTAQAALKDFRLD